MSISISERPRNSVACSYDMLILLVSFSSSCAFFNDRYLPPLLKVCVTCVRVFPATVVAKRREVGLETFKCLSVCLSVPQSPNVLDGDSTGRATAHTIGPFGLVDSSNERGAYGEVPFLSVFFEKMSRGSVT